MNHGMMKLLLDGSIHHYYISHTTQESKSRKGKVCMNINLREMKSSNDRSLREPRFIARINLVPGSNLGSVRHSTSTIHDTRQHVYASSNHAIPTFKHPHAVYHMNTHSHSTMAQSLQSSVWLKNISPLFYPNPKATEMYLRESPLSFTIHGKKILLHILFQTPSRPPWIPSIQILKHLEYTQTQTQTQTQPQQSTAPSHV